MYALGIILSMVITNGVLIIYYNYVDKCLTNELWMKELKSMVELTQLAKRSLRIVWTSLSARIRVSCAHKHMFEDKGWSTCIYYSSDEGYIRLASFSKYAFRIQNLCLFIDCSLENGSAVVYWRGGEW